MENPIKVSLEAAGDGGELAVWVAEKLTAKLADHGTAYNGPAGIQFIHEYVCEIETSTVVVAFPGASPGIPVEGSGSREFGGWHKNEEWTDFAAFRLTLESVKRKGDEYIATYDVKQVPL